MIILHLAIGEGDPQQKAFYTASDLAEHLKELKSFDCVWLATENGEKGELLITEKVDTLVNSVKNGYFNLTWNSPQHFFVQQYGTYEDAYSVALHMKEGNPKCYND